ncbi:MAG: type II toxin-antitoxin system MqsA family antitoxin [Paludibacterium sp.]|uniref:type II toxin-antitoxin system MqsA family antitoxin n=1 Tax=Paludibacterium sp. TaxID=1917523 RepID=UPI0025CDB0FE|nr:type II toxin-antitoxin system MqsA family antitoxin [Paludibacterium sp.]MBV8046479.1 type II toxin-antitoxin system MqsA family antitoxin [Paludibacterium sp.]MBV8646567.1 type II toxin-antitoxin system MqsA family antitoxin [Paludibacterium sp.]
MKYEVVPAPICPACGASHTIVQEARDLIFNYRGQTLVVPAVQGEYCTTCGEVFFGETPNEGERYAQAITAFTRKVHIEHD